MADYILLLLLRILHVGAGVFWVGAFMLLARYVIPATHAAGPAAGPFMQQLMTRTKLPAVLSGAAVVAILSGFALYGRNIMASDGAWAGTRSGMVFGLGGIAALVALIIGLVVNRPVGMRLGALAAEIGAAGGRPTAEQTSEMQRLQARVAGASRIIVVLLMVAVTAMALGRYV